MWNAGNQGIQTARNQGTWKYGMPKIPGPEFKTLNYLSDEKRS